MVGIRGLAAICDRGQDTKRKFTLSRHRQLTGASPQRPKLIGIQRFVGLPGVVAGQIGVLPAERREVREVFGSGFDALFSQMIDGSVQVHGVP